MKKIIKGKRYDINGNECDMDIATCLGEWDNGKCGCSGVQYAEERLFRKKTGEFFLHGKGGAMTIYADSRYGNVSSGEQIIPLSESEAKKWAKDHLDGDDYEGIFGEVGK